MNQKTNRIDYKKQTEWITQKSAFCWASHTARVINERSVWKLVLHPQYSPVLVSSEYHLFSSMSHSFSMKRFKISKHDFMARHVWFLWEVICKLPET
ncbi:hypothetical protein CEXT_9561 [Caerostris extrusa]|uniref:Transposase n=1 Tax=Caerostris extrusa TaxID=172846 RepID=A0AAV4YB87_CAEEX|nr:hypothetical protein CEXT_9561 [Caerostris extrusa]